MDDFVAESTFATSVIVNVTAPSARATSVMTIWDGPLQKYFNQPRFRNASSLWFTFFSDSNLFLKFQLLDWRKRRMLYQLPVRFPPDQDGDMICNPGTVVLCGVLKCRINNDGWWKIRKKKNGYCSIISITFYVSCIPFHFALSKRARPVNFEL